GQDLLDRLVEDLMSTQVWQQQLVESLERGIEQGREQGKAEGHRELLRRAIMRRFGVIPPSLEERIVAADSEALATLLDQVLVASSADQI
ncbi:MAG: DUF4351 domain-containing protein, partial [Chloroflexota bacterium]